MRSSLIAPVVALTLTACSHSTPSVSVVKPPPIPASLKVECPPLRPLVTGLCPELAASLARDSLMYSDCAARFKALVEVVEAREALK